MKHIFAICLLSISLSALAEIIELRDGTRISGRLTAVDEDAYTIFSPSIGKITVDRNKVVRIEHENSTISSANSNNESLQSIQKSMAANPAMMQSIMALSQSPEAQAVLSDPQTMQAISRGDFQSLMNNPAIQKFMDSPQLRSIVDDVQVTE